MSYSKNILNKLIITLLISVIFFIILNKIELLRKYSSILSNLSTVLIGSLNMKSRASPGSPSLEEQEKFKLLNECKNNNNKNIFMLYLSLLLLLFIYVILIMYSNN